MLPLIISIISSMAIRKNNDRSTQRRNGRLPTFSVPRANDRETFSSVSQAQNSPSLCSSFNFFFIFTANFIVQFLILSLILGIPLLTLQVCLGQRLAAGSVDMWRISPLFQGVGIALLIAQAFIGIYSIVGVSWMFVYFR